MLDLLLILMCSLILLLTLFALLVGLKYAIEVLYYEIDDIRRYIAHQKYLKSLRDERDKK